MKDLELKSKIAKRPLVDPGILFLLHKLFLFFFDIFDSILDKITGFSFKNGWREDREEAKELNYQGQIVNVVFRAHYRILAPFYLGNFFYTHHQYIDARTILDNPRAILFAIEKDFSLFTLTDDPNDFLDLTKTPFLWTFQFFLTKKLIIVRNDVLHQLALIQGNPKVPVSIIYHPGRTGSTLLSQMFFKVPGTRVLSEPVVFSYPREMLLTDEIEPWEYKRLLETALILLCKVEPDSKVERIVIKSHYWWALEMFYLAEKFPLNLVFNIRHPKASITSKMRVDGRVHSLYYYAMLKLGYNFAPAFDKTFNHYPFGCQKVLNKFNQLFRISYPTEDEYFGIVFGLCFANFLRRKDLFCYNVIYEELMANPPRILSELFQILKIPLKHVPLALRALHTDSQSNLFKGGHFDQEPNIDWHSINEMFHHMDLDITSDMSYDEFKLKNKT